MRSPRFVSVLSFVLLAPGFALSLHARDAYGNNTSWTNSDTTIRNIQIERRAQEARPQWYSSFATPLPTMTWKQQEAARLEELRKRDRKAYDDSPYSDQDTGSSARAWRERQREEAKPLSYEQALENDVLHRSDRAAQERLAFYYLSIGKPIPAIRHLEMIVFLKKSERAGDAAWELHRIARPSGAQPDAARARKYLAEAVALGSGDARFYQGNAWIFGDEKNGIAPDPAKGAALLEEVLRSDDGWHNHKAGEILFKEYYLGAHLPADPAKAIAVTQAMHLFTKPDQWQEDRYTELMIASPGGWAEHHEEILRSIERNFSAILDAPKAERLVRIYLGLDPDVAAHVPVDTKKAFEPLFNLIRMSPMTAEPYVMLLVQSGPLHNGDIALRLLEKFAEVSPANPLWIRLTAETLNNVYGDAYPTELLARYLASLDSEKATNEQIYAAARFFLTGAQGVAADPARALALYRRLTDKSVYEYQRDEYRGSLELARLLLVGGIIPQDIPAGVELLEKVSSYRCWESCPHRTLLASLYRTGELVRRDLPQARMTIAPAAAESFAPAWYEYAAIIHAWEPDADPLDDSDREEAFRRVTRAAGFGLTEARLLLADFYSEGFGTDVDLEQAIAIYEDGVKANIPGAYAGLAALYADPARSVHNEALGFEYAQKAAAADERRALYILGECFREGRGTPADPVKAVEAFVRSAELGLWDAADAAAELLGNGRDGLPADLKRAASILDAATERGSSVDQKFRTGRLFLGGRYLPRDGKRARYWLEYAAEKGSEEARALLDAGLSHGEN
jgi:TPR repeat protein